MLIKKLNQVGIVYLNHCIEMASIPPHRKEISYQALLILVEHYSEFYIKERFANKGHGKLSYYDLLDEDLFEEIFKFRKNKNGKNDKLFLETLGKIKEEKRIK